MIVFAIRHKPSGEFMPSRMSRSSARGYSYWREPDQDPYDAHPRIFFTHRSAVNALAAWLQGTWEKTMTQGSYFEPPEDDGPATSKPKVPRFRSDMEIVSFDLVEIAL